MAKRLLDQGITAMKGGPTIPLAQASDGQLIKAHPFKAFGLRGHLDAENTRRHCLGHPVEHPKLVAVVLDRDTARGAGPRGEVEIRNAVKLTHFFTSKSPRRSPSNSAATMGCQPLDLFSDWRKLLRGIAAFAVLLSGLLSYAQQGPPAAPQPGPVQAPVPSQAPQGEQAMFWLLVTATATIFGFGPAATAAKMALRSAQMVRPKERFSTLQPQKRQRSAQKGMCTYTESGALEDEPATGFRRFMERAVQLQLSDRNALFFQHLQNELPAGQRTLVAARFALQMRIAFAQPLRPGRTGTAPGSGGLFLSGVHVPGMCVNAGLPGLTTPAPLDTLCALRAEMAELVDAPGSGPGGGNTVEVRVLFSAPLEGPHIQSNGCRRTIVSSRSAPVDTTSTGTPQICSMRSR